MKILPVEDTGSFAIKVYLVKVRGFNVEDPSCCDFRIHAPIPAAATLTMASFTKSRCFGGAGSEEDAEEDEDKAWRFQDRETCFPLVEKGGRSGCKPWPRIRGFIEKTRRLIYILLNLHL